MSRNVFIGGIAAATALAVMPALAQTSSSTGQSSKPAAENATKLCSVLKANGDLTAAPPKCIADPASASITPSTAPHTGTPDLVKENKDAQSQSSAVPSDTTASPPATAKKPGKY